MDVHQSADDENLVAQSQMLSGLVIFEMFIVVSDNKGTTYLLADVR